MSLITDNTPLFDIPADKVSGTWTTTGTMDAAYPIQNAEDIRPWVPAKFTANGSSPVVILVDHATSKGLALVSFIHCNINGSVVIKRNATDSGWATPSQSVNAVVTPQGPSGWPTQWWVDMTGAGYGSYRYTRIEITSQSGLLSLGLIRLTMQLRQVGVGFRWGGTEPSHYDVAEFKTDGSIQLGHSIGTRSRQISGAFVPVIDSRYADYLLWWWDAEEGRSNPFLLIPSASVNDAWWVKWGADAAWIFERLKADKNVNMVPAVFDEVGRGMKP